MEIGELREQLKTARNRVEIAQILIDNGKFYLLPTILEDLYQGCQEILDDHCVIGEAEPQQS